MYRAMAGVMEPPGPNTFKGTQSALLDDPHLLHGLNVYQGNITYQAVAAALNVDYVNARDALERSMT
jgi:alanine dehydrogenase